MKRSILILSLIVFSTLGFAQSKVIEQLKVDNRTDASLYFYPSTLRMINLQHNEEFNELVRDIKRMIFLKFNRNHFDQIKFMNAILELQQEESMEEYIVIDGKEQKLYLLGKESPASTVAMAYFQDEYYAFDITGSISLSELPKLYEQLSNADSGLKQDFSNIFEIVGGANKFGKHIKKEMDD